MCPKCGQVLGSVNLKEVTVNAGFMGNQWLGVAYCCPYCQAILSVGIDPVALKTDTIDGVVARLGGR